MMRIMIEATDRVTEIDGVPVRYWRGTTEDGIACKVFVHRIAVHHKDDASRFAVELQEQMPPGRFVDLCMILD